MNLEDVINSYKDKIDSLKYTDSPEVWRISDQITINWKGVLPEPPKNTSDVTIKELEYLSKLTSNLSDQDREFVKIVDDDPINVFLPIMKKHKLDFKRSAFDKVWSTAYPVIMNLKHKFNRPRPYELAEYLNIKINVTETKSHHTPAYPSGHTAYAAFFAYLFSDVYPQYSSEFFSKVGTVGYARCLQGVHYPSDNEASMVISGAIWEDVRYKMFPDLYPVHKEE